MNEEDLFEVFIASMIFVVAAVSAIYLLNPNAGKEILGFFNSYSGIFGLVFLIGLTLGMLLSYLEEK